MTGSLGPAALGMTCRDANASDRSLQFPGPVEIEADVDVFRRLGVRDRDGVLAHGRPLDVAGEESEAVPQERLLDRDGPADAARIHFGESRVNLAVHRDRVRD